MFRKILTVATLVLVLFVVWGARDQIIDAVNYLSEMNIFVLLLLVPEQLFMYYCAGQIFFSYMRAKGRNDHLREGLNGNGKVSTWLLARIAFELNFVNHAIPSGGVAGLGYITWRLKSFGSSVGQTSFMYMLRYVITILANQLQTIVAIIILIAIGGVIDSAWWVIGLTTLICIGVIAAVVAVVIVASSKKRIDWAAKISTKFLNNCVRILTFGHKRQVIKREVIEKYLSDIYADLVQAKADKKILIRPVVWGIVYSFFEIATYWIVGISMGHPEILPAVMISEAIASVIGAVLLTPGGMGGYEGAMVMIMSALGVDATLATMVVITTRVVVLVATIASGYGFYQNAVSKIGKKERAEIMGETGK